MAWNQLVAANPANGYPNYCLGQANNAYGRNGSAYCAKDAWDQAQFKHFDRDLPNVAVPVWFTNTLTIGNETRDFGHVAIWFPDRGQFMNVPASGYGIQWLNSIDEVNNWNGCNGYLGWSEDIEGLQVASWTPDAPLLGNQRISNGSNRRAEPTSQSALLEPMLQKGDIGNFDGWIYGEDPYGNGNNIWFRGISGNWFYSGTFQDPGIHDLADLNPAPQPTQEEPKPVEPTPEPVDLQPTPEPTKPVDPIQPEKEKPMTPQETAEIIARQQALAASIKPADLGNIITNNKVRKVVWAIYGVLGLCILGFMGGLQAIQAIGPEWFMFIVGAYAALGPAFSTLAIANIPTKK